MNVTRRGALVAGAAALAGWLPPSRVLLAAAAQETSPARLLTQAYNASGQQLFKQLASAPGNIVFSPYSIGTAMAMALAGARGETERQMIAVLAQSLTRPQIDAANAQVLATLNGYDHSSVAPTCPQGLRFTDSTCEGPAPAGGGCTYPARRDGNKCVAAPTYAPSAQLSVADALMLTSGDGLIAKEYIALLKTDYAAEVFENASLFDINAWVTRKTHGKIDKILDQLDPNSAAVLLNAVYFKAKWASSFPPSATANGRFRLTASQETVVPTMRRSGAYTLAAREGYRALRLPYEVDALGMVIVLPNEIEGAAAIGGKLDEKELSELFCGTSHAATPGRPGAAALQARVQGRTCFALQAGRDDAAVRCRPGRFQRHDRIVRSPPCHRRHRAPCRDRRDGGWHRSGRGDRRYDGSLQRTCEGRRVPCRPAVPVLSRR